MRAIRNKCDMSGLPADDFSTIAENIYSITSVHYLTHRHHVTTQIGYIKYIMTIEFRDLTIGIHRSTYVSLASNLILCTDG